LADAEARRHATNPAENIVLEASAGTGKTRVLVERYVNLLLASVEPENILAITFTRKAAAEMRQRILERLRAASHAQIDAARWRDLRERLGDIAISTIDAFCLSLIREFPLEADVDPGFDLADETEIPRLVDEALDSALRIGRHVARQDDDVAMVFVQLGERRLRSGLAALVGRRLVARDVLRDFLDFGPRDLTPAVACQRAAERLRDLVLTVPGGIRTFLEDGPLSHPQFAMLAVDLARLCDPDGVGWGSDGGQTPAREDQAAFRMLVDRVQAYFLTQDGKPRKATGFGQAEFKKHHCRSEASWKAHRDTVEAIAPAIMDAVKAFRRDVNVILSRGVWRLFHIAVAQYVRTLESHAVLDFSEVLSRAVELLRQMEEFSRSRYKLEARYHHVLVDELQDTSRAQWELVSLLVKSWGEGFGASAGALPPSIFVVGDRKQSIYGFRDAEAAVLSDAAGFIETLRPEGQPRQAISVSFRASPALLAFVNDLFAEIAMTSDAQRRDAFRYDERDRFPLDDAVRLKADATHGDPPASCGVRLQPDHGQVGFIAGDTVETAADRVADEIVRLLAARAVVRDRHTGVPREVKPGDVAVLFRSRDSHREYEAALDRRGVPAYVYKGLGFFDADEIQDAVALLRFLADPTSDIRAAGFMRSRIVRLSDRAVAQLAPRLARALTHAEPPAVVTTLDPEDRAVLARVRDALPRWLAQVDLVTPAELLDAVLRDTAYAFEIRGPRRVQARENLKKLRGLIRRIQNRGYATLARIADHLEQLALGDESNAVVDALDAVNLMTVHAAKGLEFPIVFVVNLGRGTGGPRAPIRVVNDGRGTPSVAIGDFESDADEDASTRDREETKRLLYVALTRARDRLYLSAVVKNGAFKPGPGSLGAVLPRSIVGRIEQSASDGHEAPVPMFVPAVPTVAAADRFDVIVDPLAVRRVPVVRYLMANGTAPSAVYEDAESIPADGTHREAGTLAHRLFADPSYVASGSNEASGFSRVKNDRAIVLAKRLREHPDVATLLASGRALYEVPFSMQVDDRTIVRGSIDCLVTQDNGRITIIELKTGARRPEHGEQLAVYLDAARTLFPGETVDGLLVYADL
jgi:ATP-dependent helicase/nuclease subunit A